MRPIAIVIKGIHVINSGVLYLMPYDISIRLKYNVVNVLNEASNNENCD